MYCPRKLRDPFGITLSLLSTTCDIAHLLAFLSVVSLSSLIPIDKCVPFTSGGRCETKPIETRFE